ncbi:hypothetical protein DRP04_09130 [Archaeoglobales archaeon]|nr:MAG: hypothetical protein DRP04_09130 [Archaeoglobales archaeon]
MFPNYHKDFLTPFLFKSSHYTKYNCNEIHELAKQAIELRRQGYSYEQIAKHFGVSKATVYRRLNNNGDYH